MSAIQNHEGIALIQTTTEEPRLLYARKEASRKLSICVRSLDYLIATKQLATRRLGKRVMIPHCELVRFSKTDHTKPITKKKD
jgi:hypothetical protein